MAASATKSLPDKTSEEHHRFSWSWKKLFGKDDHHDPPQPQHPTERPNLARTFVGLPRAGTFKRQQSELRDNLEPAIPEPSERRAVSADRRKINPPSSSNLPSQHSNLSAPNFFESTSSIEPLSVKKTSVAGDAKVDETPAEEAIRVEESELELDLPGSFPEPPPPLSDHESFLNPPSVSDDDQDDDPDDPFLDNNIIAELEEKWILNISMHFRDRSKREKFFVTYAESPKRWRRVTISVDYRDAPRGSLEADLYATRYQRDKSARIYQAIRESLPDIQFYDTVTNLKLQTEDDRLHVHVTEDVHEIIPYPPMSAIEHLNCRKVREDQLSFDSHLSGFVYKVRVGKEVLIKKEIPGPDTIDEFLYEINALRGLIGARSVVQFQGVIVDPAEKFVKGLLISFAEQGALVDVIYDERNNLAWARRERWARQIVQGVSEIHEGGWIQGDLTLSNVVIDADDNAKIIDINRRGCPVNWEPPELMSMIQNRQRIHMYIGIKSDLWQMGICLWALATQSDEPEMAPRPFTMEDFDDDVPAWYRNIVDICLSEKPRERRNAIDLLKLFPEELPGSGHSRVIRTIEAGSSMDQPYLDPNWSSGRMDPITPRDTPTLEQMQFQPQSSTVGVARSDISAADSYPSRGRSPAPRIRPFAETHPHINVVTVSPTTRGPEVPWNSQDDTPRYLHGDSLPNPGKPEQPQPNIAQKSQEPRRDSAMAPEDSVPVRSPDESTIILRPDTYELPEDQTPAPGSNDELGSLGISLSPEPPHAPQTQTIDPSLSFSEITHAETQQQTTTEPPHYTPWKTAPVGDLFNGIGMHADSNTVPLALPLELSTDDLDFGADLDELTEMAMTL